MRKYFFFALIAISVFSILPSVFADVQGPPITQRFKDYQIVSYPNGTHVQTIGMAENVFDGYNWVDRIIRNNGTHYNVYSEMGSFSFNKSTCTITQYVKGYNPLNNTLHSSDIVIDNWFWTIARKNGGAWTVIDASLFNCSITTSANSTGKYLTMTRTDTSSGSYLKVTLAAPKDKPMEDFNELYMNRTAWNGNKFAFVLWAKGVHADTITARNGTTVQIPNGVTMIDRSGLTTNSLDFIKNGNPFYFDWGKAAPYFKTLLLNKTGSNVDVQFGFNNNAPTLNVGQRMFLDPTYGYTAGTVYNLKSTAGNCATNDNGKEAPYVGSDGVRCYYVVIQWDTTTIPDADAVTNTNLRYDATFNFAISCNAVSIANKPSTANNATRQADIKAGVVYADLPDCDTTGNNFVTDLGTTADADVQSHLAANWFAVGLIKNPDTSAANAYTLFGSTIELEVTYVVPTPPNRVSTLSATPSSTSTVDLSWSAPGLNGGTLSGYRINSTTPYGNPSTIVIDTSTSATNYIVSGLSTNTPYSFRVSAITQFGKNATGNIANATTLSFNTANFTVGHLSFNADNPNSTDIFFVRTDINTTALYLNVTYPDTWELACDFHYKFAMTNKTYDNLSYVTVDADSIMSTFQFLNVNNEIINVLCWDENGTGSGKYLITQTSFPLLQYLTKFSSGHYGTQGDFGSIDLIYLAVILVAMVGLNRTNESVGAGFMIVITGACTYFHIITIQTAVISGIALVILLIIISTRKD